MHFIKLTLAALPFLVSAANIDSGSDLTRPEHKKPPAKVLRFDLERVAVDDDVLRAGSIKAKTHNSKAYKNNTGVKHLGHNLTVSLNKRALIKTIVLTKYNTPWFSYVWVGTPAKKFKVVFDTEHCNFMLAATLDTCEALNVGRNDCGSDMMGYNPDASTSAKESEHGEDPKAGGSSRPSKIVTDKVVLGPVWDSQAAVNQRITVTMQPENHWDIRQAHGSIGIGPPVVMESFDSHPPPDLTFLEALHTAGKFDNFEYSLDIGRDKAELVVGGYNAGMQRMDFLWFEALSKPDNPGQWTIIVEDIVVGTKHIALEGDAGKAVIASGNSFIYGPEHEVTQLHRAFGTQATSFGPDHPGIWKMPCSLKGVSRVGFTITRLVLSLDADTMWGEAPEDKEICVSNIRSWDNPGWSFGIPFFLNYVVGFVPTPEANKIGFAPKILSFGQKLQKFEQQCEEVFEFLGAACRTIGLRRILASGPMW